MRFNPTPRWIVLTLTAGPLLAVLAGCYENHHHHEDKVVVREEHVVVDPPPPERVVVREPVPDRVIVHQPPPERVVIVDSPTWYDDPRYTGKWVTDTRDRHWHGADRNVPKIAKEVAIGRNIVRWVADRDSVVWVTESEHDTVLWYGRVWRGEPVDIVPKHNRIFVGNHEVAHPSKMPDNIRYRVFSDLGKLK